MIIAAMTTAFPPRALYAAYPHTLPTTVPAARSAKIQMVLPTAFSNTRMNTSPTHTPRLL